MLKSGSDSTRDTASPTERVTGNLDENNIKATNMIAPVRRYVGARSVKATDPKHRVSFPHSMRGESLSEKFFLIACPDLPRIIGFHLDSPAFDEKTLNAISPFAEAIALDSSNRILLSSNLHQRVRFEEEDTLTFVGCSRYFEIWATSAWEERQEARKQLYETNMRASLKNIEFSPPSNEGN